MTRWYLATVVLALPGARRRPAGLVANAFMTVDAVATVKLLGDGETAECRLDVRGATHADAAAAAVAAAERAGTTAGLEPHVLTIKLQTEAERLAALPAL